MTTPVEQKSVQKIKLRPASKVMRLKRMGSFHQSRLSFMRVLLRRLKAANWKFDRPIWDMNENGVGVATYRAIGPERTYTLVAFGHDLPDEQRSDRVIAEAWDSTFTLVDGEVSKEDIERLSKNVPLQEAGRVSGRELSLSRANKSVRLFKYVSDCLAAGKQPSVEEIKKVGYLMRTTAVYGSGKFGAADRDVWGDRPEFRGSFQPELLSVWLTRQYTIDLVEHVASARAPEAAVKLQPEIRRQFGVGNSTGLGMAPFLINHPSLIHSWINGRETALARICSLEAVDPAKADHFCELVERASLNAETWFSEHPLQVIKIKDLKSDFKILKAYLAEGTWRDTSMPWAKLIEWSETALSLEGQEQVVSLVIEPYGELVDDLAANMQSEESRNFRIPGHIAVAEMVKRLEVTYDWALSKDFTEREEIARVWYVSAEKLEPRLGERFEEPIEPYEQPLAPARDAAACYAALKKYDPNAKLGEFMMQYPEFRHVIRRLQIVEAMPYAEVRDNTIASDMLPIDLLRCKLSFFGATKFDPRSDRWVRITMFQGAPYPDELADCDPEDMAYPALD